jgi:hypothetical protein
MALSVAGFIDRVLYASTGRRIALQPIFGKVFPTKRCVPRAAFAHCSGGFVRIMPTVSDFQNYAAACTRLAGASDTEANKTTLLMMAEKWTDLAAEAGRIRELIREADAILEASAAATQALL